MRHEVAQQQSKEDVLEQRNAILAADITSLKKGKGAIEARARTELGMIKRGEVFYQVVS